MLEQDSGQDRACNTLKGRDFWRPWAKYSPQILHKNNKYDGFFAVGQCPLAAFPVLPVGDVWCQ